MPLKAFDCDLVATEAVGKEAGDAADRGDADPGQVMNTAIWQVLLQIADDLPAIYERLQFRRRTQVFQEIATFIGIAQCRNGFEQRILGAAAGCIRILAVWFHGS
jgi:hypothetical protein